MVTDKLRNVKKYYPYLFLFALVLSIQFSSDIVLDKSLVFRIILITIILSIWILVSLLHRNYNNLRLYPAPVFLYFFVVVLYFSVSVFWANTYSLSIIGISKLYLFITLFLLLNLLLNQYGNTVVRLIVKAIVVAFLLSLYSIVSQLFQLTDFSYSTNLRPLRN